MKKEKVRKAALVRLAKPNQKVESLESFDKVIVEIKSKEDEQLWKQFLKKYFPNHYASGILNEDLVIDMDLANKGKAYESKSIGIDEDGFGYLSFKLAYFGGFKEVANFEEFTKTKCYKAIINNGVSLKVGEPKVVKIPY